MTSAEGLHLPGGAHAAAFSHSNVRSSKPMPRTSGGRRKARRVRRAQREVDVISILPRRAAPPGALLGSSITLAGAQPDRGRPPTAFLTGRRRLPPIRSEKLKRDAIAALRHFREDAAEVQRRVDDIMLGTGIADLIDDLRKSRDVATCSPLAATHSCPGVLAPKPITSAPSSALPLVDSLRYAVPVHQGRAKEQAQATSTGWLCGPVAATDEPGGKR
jgi:hypothetical protein